MMSDTYRLQPLVVGTFTAIPLAHFRSDAAEGTTVQAPCISWLARGDSGDYILVDTGPGDPSAAGAKNHYPFVREPGQRIDAALRAVGVDPAAITSVILTHLHFDHCADGSYLPNATFFVQRTELEYAEEPDPRQERAYDIGFEGIEPAWWAIRDRITLVDGDHQLTPGCNILHTPGHTPGSASAVFHAEGGQSFAVAGDLISRVENWSGEGGEHLPPGLVTSLADCVTSWSALEHSAEVVLASHDERMLDFHVSYPLHHSSPTERSQE
jgi:N-acyl homoserine lactone hydrolase